MVIRQKKVLIQVFSMSLFRKVVHKGKYESKHFKDPRYCLSGLNMNPNQCLDLEKQMAADLQKKATNPKYSLQVIHGTGFKHLSLNSDIVNIPSMDISNIKSFMDSYLSTISLISEEANKALSNFCEILPFVTTTQWKKFDFLSTDHHGKGSWIGLFFRRTGKDTCEFYANHIKCAFELAPDILVLRKEESCSFLFLKGKLQSDYIVERNRGFTRADLAAVLDVCSFVTSSKAMLGA